jgi:hypothetical protein
MAGSLLYVYHGIGDQEFVFRMEDREIFWI